MSDSIYSFRSGPTYRGSRQAHFDAAMDEPLSGFSTFFDQAKGGALESFGLGTAIRDFAIPEGDLSLTAKVAKGVANLANPLTAPFEATRQAVQGLRPDSPRLTEEQYKGSAYYRENIPWDEGMTQARAEALASWDDAKRVREFYAEKRPITSFIGNFAGQALDPINYVPVAGPAVKAAAVARFGRVAGTAAVGSLDAAANTALFGIGTRERRAAYGDDVSWEMMTSEIAMAALIGAAFGTIGGVVEGRAARRAQDSLSTLKATQQARIALNDAIDGVVRGEDIRLGGNASEAVTRAADEVAALDVRAARVARDPQLVSEQIDRVVRQRGSVGQKPPAPASLMQFLAGKTVGGLKDESGELASMGLTGRFVPGRGKLVRQNGMSLDYARELAAEEGYFDHLYGSPDEAMAKSTPADLLNLLSEEAGGKPAYRGIDQGMLADRDIFERSLRERDAYRSLVEDVNAAAKEMGLTDLLDDRVLVRASELADSGHTADEALERALDEDYRAYAEREADGFDDTDIPFFQEDAGTSVDAGRQAGEAREGSRAGAGGGTPQAGRRLPNSRSTPAQEVAPGRKEAEARVGRPDDYKALADQYRVDPQTGDFPEMADIDQLRSEGRLTDEDQAALDEAKAVQDDADAYGEAIKVAAGCLI